MAQRTEHIARVMIDLLASWEEPVDEAVLHSQVDARIVPSVLLSEFQDTLAFCEKERLITGVRNVLRGTRWAITDKGRATRHA